MTDNPQEKWTKWREIILNIIKEKPDRLIEKEKNGKQKIKKSNKFSKYIFLFTVFIFCFFVGFLIIFGIGLYKYHWNNKETMKIIKIIPYPIAIIDNKKINNLGLIRYSEFQENLKAVKLFFQKQKQNDSTFQILSDKMIEENTFNMMIEDYLISKTLQKNGIVIGKKEIDKKIQEIINQVGSEQQFKKIIKNLYDWNPNQFKEKAIKQMILQEKIENLIAPKDLRDWLDEELKKVKIYKFI